MSFIFCPECGTKLSEHAVQCLNCAYPIASRRANPSQQVYQHRAHNHPSIPHEKRIDNTLIWFLAFAPLIGSFLEGFFWGFLSTYTQSNLSIDRFWWVTIALNIILCAIDEKRLEQKGVDVDKLGSAWLVPVYLYKRATLLQQSPAYFWVWIACFILMFLEIL